MTLMVQFLARGNIVGTKQGQAIRCGRVVALQKPDGGVRGIVVGDTLRWWHELWRSNSLPKWKWPLPHQYALKTEAGCETVAHILQVLTELDEEATVVLVDGMEAFRGRDVVKLRLTAPHAAVCEGILRATLQLLMGGRRG